MVILSIETSTKVCSAALSDGTTIYKQFIHRESANHAVMLPEYIENLLAYAREQRLQIDAIALSGGPGSYTGLRIGTSMAKGLCYGMNIPLIPIDTTLVIAAAMRDKAPQGALLCPMIDARRMEVYTALYNDQLEMIKPIEARVVEDSQWLVETGQEVYYAGDGAEKCQEVLHSERLHLIEDIVPEAQYMGSLAEKANRVDRIAYYEPFYLKEFVAAPSHVKGLTTK
ncbi:MAG: tRNA (adenosine(37)-N6)-threonylcarbamoyltransferase complex dimerization subunit type 1 TsaB [Paludibacteraceae bacterium]|nr:tRNA (adenosine(37)-N6)-threonylcarbamoyltransferase complex dimerization subunit type 1 TsaB [Paludibacteraceae bacterium]